MKEAREFRDVLIAYFEDKACPKTSWGKNEVAIKIRDLWMEWTEKHYEEHMGR